MSKPKKRQQEFMKYAGCMSGPPDLSSRRGFEIGPDRRVEKVSRRTTGRRAGTGIDSVYLLYHLHKRGESADTQVLLIGAYRSEDDAIAAIKKLRSKPGFSKYPNGFEYHAYRLGVENWAEGF